MLDLLNRLMTLLEGVAGRADGAEFLRALALVLLAASVLVMSLR